MASDDFELPEDLADNVDIVYIEDEEIDNLEDDIADPDEDLEPPEDKSTISFKGHSKSVFCVNFNNNATLAVSGGEDDLAFVWNVLTGNVELECTGHTDSVILASFSYDNKYVATGDMNGLIQVWEIENKKLTWCYEASVLEWLIWHHSANVLLSGCKSGEIYMWQIPQGNCKIFPSANSDCVAGVLLPNGSQAIAGYKNGSIRVWDLKSASVVCQLNGDPSNGFLHGLKISTDGKLAITCGLSVGAIVLKTADCKIVATLQGQETDQIETAAFCPEPDLPIVATGNLNGDICLWDISRQSIRHKMTIGYAVTIMQWGPNAMLFVASVDANVYVYNGRNGQLMTTITGHMSDILDMQLSKDSKLLMTSSDDCTAKVFELKNCCSISQY